MLDGRSIGDYRGGTTAKVLDNPTVYLVAPEARQAFRLTCAAAGWVLARTWASS